MSRGEVFVLAVGILQDGRSVEVVGEHGSGRTHFLAAVRDHFVALGWNTINVAGIEALRSSPLMALSIAGLTGVPEGRVPPLVAAYDALKKKVERGRVILIVDDSDSIDDASWGVLSAVSAQLSVPMLTVRLRRTVKAPTMRYAGAFTSIYTLELPPMTYTELSTALEQRMGSRFDSSTMSRIFAKSGGNIGLADAIVDAARRSGDLRPGADGVLRAGESLWTPALRAVVGVILQSVPADDVAALEVLALLGPADLDTVLKIVDRARVVSLEDQGFVSLVPTGDRLVVAVVPPILVEYFRHDTGRAQRDEILGRIDDTLGRREQTGGGASDSADVAAYVRLLHERARVRVMRAREEWRAQPSLTAAAELLRALQADVADPADEVDALAASVDRLEGSSREQAEWTVAYTFHLASSQGKASEAVALLRRAAEAHPAEAVLLGAHAFELEIAYTRVPDALPFEGLTVTRLGPLAREAVVRAQAFWLVVRGDVSQAAELLDAYAPEPGVDPRIDALQVYVAGAEGDFDRALKLSRTQMEAARSRLDASRMRVYAFLTALSAFFARDQKEAETAVADALVLGLQPGESPLSYIGLTLLGAYFAAKRGQRALAAEYLADLDASELPDASLAFLQRGFVHMRLAVFDDDAAGAARIAREAADELWERGALLAASALYLDGVRTHPSRAEWEHARPRIAQVDSVLIRRASEFVGALVDADAETLLAWVNETVEKGRTTEAAYAAHLAAAALASVGDTDAGSDVMRQLAAVAGSSAGSLPHAFSARGLTNREREIARLIAAGLSNPQIADALVVSTRTVESHVTRLKKKLSAHDREDIRMLFLSGTH